jgi:hypothetical protein
MLHRRRTASSFLEVFSLNPLPYPVLLILAVIFIFLGLQWYVSYEEVIESTEQGMGWALLAVPVALILIVRWLSTIQNPERLFWSSPWDRHRRLAYLQSEGSSPWGVLALILLLLVLVQYQSTFLDSWFI